jgi:hypothetical protein
MGLLCNFIIYLYSLFSKSLHSHLFANCFVCISIRVVPVIAFHLPLHTFSPNHPISVLSFCSHRQALIEWTRCATDAPTDAFEVKRHGHMDTQCRLAFHFDHAPEKFQLPPGLVAALGMQVRRGARGGGLQREGETGVLCIVRERKSETEHVEVEV